MGVTPSPSHSFSHARGFYKTRENNLHWSQTIPGVCEIWIWKSADKELCWLDSELGSQQERPHLGAFRWRKGLNSGGFRSKLTFLGPSVRRGVIPRAHFQLLCLIPSPGNGHGQEGVA